jgi:NADPH:quinone reductase-like Zn-dependent oxidoreductase
MRVQKYTSNKGVLEKHLELYTSQPLPKPSPHQHLIKVLAVGPNTVDFKPVETPNIGWPAAKKPATPGSTSPAASSLQPMAQHLSPAN